MAVIYPESKTSCFHDHQEHKADVPPYLTSIGITRWSIAMNDQELTQDQLDAVGRLAKLVSDPWLVGEAASLIHRKFNLTDEQISECLLERHQRELTRQSIQA